MRNRPDVSVSIITYNHRELIGKAIDSVLMQETDFSYEIVIGDDCSNDGTQDILREYQQRHPDKIQLILHPRRYTGEVAGRTNNTTNLLNCRGRYTAMLDGDDFWTDPGKLQRQYDRMEAMPELSLCLHDARMVYDTTPEEPDYPRRLSHRVGGSSSGVYSQEDLCRREELHPFIGSVLYRTELLRDLPDWFYEVIAADYALLLHLSRSGPLYYDDRVDAAYYISPGGFQRIYRNSPDHLMQELRDLDTYARNFPATKENLQYTRGRARINWHLFCHFREQRRFSKAVPHLFTMLRHDPIFGISQFFNPVKKVRSNKRARGSGLAGKSTESSTAIRS